MDSAAFAEVPSSQKVRPSIGSTQKAVLPARRGRTAARVQVGGDHAHADPPWSDEQRQLIENAAAWLERAHGDREEAQQVVKAVRQVWKGSIRQRDTEVVEGQ